MCKLGRIPEDKKLWIETTMLELREKTTNAELNCSDFLMKNNIEFINQAPFILDDKIFFADFFLPKHNIIIEVDGGYHLSESQKKLDELRDSIFNGYKLKTIRIPNSATYDERTMRIYLSEIFPH